MMHLRFSHRHSFHEARLLMFAGETPSVPDAPPPTETKVDAQANAVNVAKNKDVHAEAGKRIDALKKQLEPLRKQLSDINDLKAKITPGGDVDQDAAKSLKIDDTSGDGKVDQTEVDTAHKEAEDAVKKVENDMNLAHGDRAASLDAIKKTGPAGKIDAAMMQLEDAMKNGGSIGETLVAIAEVIKTLKDLFNGVDTGSDSGKGGPEAGKKGPAGDRAKVKDMMTEAQKKDPTVKKLSDLKTFKQGELATQEAEKTRVLGEAGVARTGLATAETNLATANALPTDDPTRATKVQEATAARDTAKTLVTGLEKAVADIEAKIAEIKKDQELIKDVELNGDKAVEKFNIARAAVTGALKSVIGNLPDDVPADVRQSLSLVEDVLLNNNAKLSDNGIDLEFKTNGKSAVEVVKAFSDQGITETDFKIDPTTSNIGNPDGFLSGVQTLIKKVQDKTKAGEKK